MSHNHILSFQLEKKLKKILVVFLFVVSWTGKSQDATEVTMEVAFEDALVYDYEYQAAVLRYKAELHNVPIAKASLYPRVTGQINEAYTRETLTAPGVNFVVEGDANYRGRSFAVQLRQVIFNRELFATYKKSTVSYTHLTLPTTPYV